MAARVMATVRLGIASKSKSGRGATPACPHFGRPPGSEDTRVKNDEKAGSFSRICGGPSSAHLCNTRVLAKDRHETAGTYHGRSRGFRHRPRRSSAGDI